MDGTLVGVFARTDYELAWPQQAFLREAEAMLAEPRGEGWHATVEELLTEAFTCTIPVEQFGKPVQHQAVQAALGRGSRTDAMLGALDPGGVFLRELRSAAEAWSTPEPRRALWSQRQGGQGERSGAAADLQGFAAAFLQAVQELEVLGYFEHRIPTGCDDLPVRLRGDGRGLLRQVVGADGLWPLRTTGQFLDPGPDPDPGLMFTLVEALHDLVARPRYRSWHSYMRHHHCSGFATETGRLVYRYRVNAALAGAHVLLRLADYGEDVGRLVHTVGDDRVELVTRVLASPQPEEARVVAHALALFRSRTASVDEKRSAIVALARVLEDRRALLRAELFRADEGALFRIANEFDLRHSRAGQQGDYDPVFLDWVFWWYLATIELTDRLIARQESN